MNFFSAFIFALTVAISGTALAQQSADVAVVTSMTGGVTCACDSKQESLAVKPFMRVHARDRFVLPAGWTLRLVYAESGRTELWKGPARFAAGREQSAAATTPAESGVLPPIA